eukprot:TRINITY_DN4158_c0_g1_i1.p1 TRINITY_DN4158_c0_g1~~TRINITY_DN4158_c0_g1_i1.p1  ORF type:complete len:181 (-),score=37.99 TRINITY_DN4158_c0_g1_i1:69-611(-)
MDSDTMFSSEKFTYTERADSSCPSVLGMGNTPYGMPPDEPPQVAFEVEQQPFMRVTQVEEESEGPDLMKDSVAYLLAQVQMKTFEVEAMKKQMANIPNPRAEAEKPLEVRVKQKNDAEPAQDIPEEVIPGANSLIEPMNSMKSDVDETDGYIISIASSPIHHNGGEQVHDTREGEPSDII